MSNRVFVISDTHFGHEAVLRFEPSFRPFSSIQEHDEALVERWNSVVRQGDTVWHLGDVYFGGKDNHYILARLNGRKHLVMGNHDAYPLDCYSKYFTRIFGAASLRNCILTHVPVHPSQLEFRFKYNIHGHMHSHIIGDPRYINVSAEQTDLTPVLLDELLENTIGRGPWPLR